MCGLSSSCVFCWLNRLKELVSQSSAKAQGAGCMAQLASLTGVGLGRIGAGSGQVMELGP